MRKRSPATELRHARAEEKELRKLVSDLLDELRQRTQCGQMMSNICYNLSQNESYDAQHRQSMKDCRGMWDAIKRVPR